MTHDEIRACLAARGLNLAMIAEALEVTPVAVGQVTARKTTSRRIAAAVASALGRSLADVFPDIQSYRRDSSRENRTARVKELKALIQVA